MNPNKSNDAPGCVCEGNWQIIIDEAADLLDKKFKDPKGRDFVLCGVMHGADDYYYCMWRESGMELLSCVGNLEQHGFTLWEEIEYDKR